MSATNPLFVKQFTRQDQDFFADLSGDRNPMHMDALAARRTQAGAPVIHGLHTLLWCLDQIAGSLASAPAINSLRSRFSKLVYIGDTATAVLGQPTDRSWPVTIFVNGVVVCRILIGFGELAPPTVPQCEYNPAPNPEYALDIPFADLDTKSGNVSFPCEKLQIVEAFPNACRLLQPERVLSLLTTTTLVGMVCPGLHSIFGDLTVSLCSLTDRDAALEYRVTATDSRFRSVQMEIEGPGLSGVVGTFARMPPAKQVIMGDVAQRLDRNIFTDTIALVVGGSRGLGELTAKILAAGGAHVIITFSVGHVEALAVAEEIQEWGGRCDVMNLDIRGDITSQLAVLSAQPTHFYYFATPQIFQRKPDLFVPERFQEFLKFYVTAFYSIFRILYGRAGARLSAFYPSSVAIEERPADMTEYAMSKIAGELLCADIEAHLPNARVIVSRLPRLATDQTASLQEIEMNNSLDVLLPIVTKVQRRVAPN